MADDRMCEIPQGWSAAQVCNALESDSSPMWEACRDVGDHFDYLHLHYCVAGSAPAGSLLLLFAWLVYLILVLGTTADQYFVPLLVQISELLRLPPAVAGVTLLAFGNAAPDVFTSLAGVAAHDFDLVQGALFGAAIFITSVVVSSVVVASPTPFTVPKLPFIRDVVVFFAALLMVVLISEHGSVSLWHSSALLLLWILYVVVAVHWGRKRKTVEFLSETDTLQGSSASSDNTDVTNGGEVSLQIPTADAADMPLLGEHEDLAVEVDSMYGLRWSHTAKWYEKALFVAEWPVALARWCTIPSANADTWNRHRRLCSAVSLVLFGPLFTFVASEETLGEFWAHVPAVVWILAIGLAAATLFWKTTNDFAPPRYAPLLLLVGFLAAICWLEIVAGEIVALMQSIGIIFRVSSGLLGMTVVAIGNSVADLAANTGVSRAGKANMAFSSCFGAPLLAILAGMGLALMIQNISHFPEPYPVHVDGQMRLGWAGMALTLLVNCVAMPVARFQPSRRLAGVLGAAYVFFFVAAIVVEFA